VPHIERCWLAGKGTASRERRSEADWHGNIKETRGDCSPHRRSSAQDNHLLKEEDIADRVKVARIVQKLLSGALDLPDRPWHDWDDWVKGLE